MIATWALAIAQGLNIRAFTDIVLPYPTLSEIGKRAAIDFFTPRFDAALGCGASLLVAESSVEAAIGSGSGPSSEAKRRSRGRARTWRVGLSGKLLLLTILFVMVAEILIYVPSVANFRLNWLNDRLAAAHTAALVLDAAPSGMVPESLANQILDKHRRARGGDEDGQSAPPARRVRHAVRRSRRDIDMRQISWWQSIFDAFDTLFTLQAAAT